MNARDMLAFTMGLKAGEQIGFTTGHRSACATLDKWLYDAARKLGQEAALQAIIDQATKEQVANLRVSAAALAKVKGGHA